MTDESKQPATQGMSLAEAERFAARQKSYVSHAALVLILYFVFYLPGLIANLAFLTEAKRIEEIAGQEVPGKRYLEVLLWLAVGFAVLVILFYVIVFISVIVDA